MSLTFGTSPVLLVACLLAAAGLTFWMYRRTTPPVGTALRAVLMSLRFAALFLVLFLLFEPMLRRLERDTQPPVLAVLVDDSQSVGLAADADTAAAGTGERVRDALRRLPADQLGGDVRLFAFSDVVRGLPEGEAAVDSLGFGGTRTNITNALDHVRDALADDNLRGVLLVSDGRYNTGRNPLYTAERYLVPVYTLVVGDTTRRRDVQVRRVTTNDLAYVGTAAPVQVGLLADGFEGETVRVTLQVDGQVAGGTTVRLPAGTAEVPVDLTYEPDRAGLRRLTVSVSRLDGETTYRNNAESVTVRVLESRRRILLLGAAPSPDVASLRQMLAADPSTEVLSFVQQRRGAFYEGQLPADLGEVDLMVLAGYPGRAADAAAIARVAEAAAGGVPFVYLLDRQTDLAALQRHFGELLPVAPSAVRQSFVEAAFVPTEAGQAHPVLAVPEAAPVSWRRLPPLTYNESRWTPSPDARVLATTEVRGVPLGDPFLVLRSRAGQRSAAFLGTDTWRWKNVPSDLSDAADLWPTLFENLVQWLAAREDDRPVRVSPVRDLFGGEEPVQFTGQVYDESLNPIDDAEVRVDVTAPDSAHYPYAMKPIGNGRYVLDVGALPEGTYAYRAEAQRGGVVLGEDEGAFAVGSLTLEFKDMQADAALMRQIAQRSGGQALDDARLEALPAALAGSGTFTPLVREEERRDALWRRYGFLAAVLVLLTVEWFLRKRSGMV